MILLSISYIRSRSGLVKHTLIANTRYRKVTGEQELEKDMAALISYMTLFLANPDLPLRFELNAPERQTMFGDGEEGYIDYPFLQI